ncbi:hypothetical protein [Burkholderia seminalis]|uniref:hypothetical protein n=1 Tax=Burkholderia seminalis TaxID=488731 RepID=UPI001F29FA50|nr:hypothetical protein [Burkholderia seminalis]
MKQTEIIEQLKQGAPSPIPFDNSLYYLARMTGTGDVWRSKQGEMFRPPDYYLTPEFLDRCAGVPVIMNHPTDSATINPADVRIVGTVIHAFPNPADPTEILCVMRIIDGFMQQDLLTKILSTSPSIVVAGSVESDGVIVEGAPIAAPDHLAICELGVWDHQGPPSGIEQTILPASDAESITAELEDIAQSGNEITLEENKQADSSGNPQFNEHADAGNAQTIDWLASIQVAAPKQFGSPQSNIHSGIYNMTAEELKALMTQVLNDSVAPLRAEIEALKVAKVQNDSTDEEKPTEEVKKENDAVPAAVEQIAGPLDTSEVAPAPVTNDGGDEAQEDGQNAAIAELKAKIAALEAAAVQAPVLSDEEEADIADAQVHADSVYQMHGQRAPRPMDRETLLAYRRRLAKGLQKFSDSQKDVKIAAINDSQYLAYVEKQVYADAAKAAHAGVAVKQGLQKIKRQDEYGRISIDYVGDIGSWMADSSLPVSIVKPNQARKYVTV